MRAKLAAAVLVAAAAAGAANAAPPPTVAALGDSITRGFNAGWIPFRDAPGSSWAALAACRLGAPTTYNDARDGARMRDLPAQAALAVQQQATNVTILMGANDLCHRGVAQMTPVARFRADLE